MKKNVLICILLSSNVGLNAQFLLEKNEDFRSKSHYVIKKVQGSNLSPEDSTKLQNAPAPILNFGSDLSTGSEAIGFRPAILASTSLSTKYFFFQPSIRITQVDDQKFDLEKTGQSLFIKEISNLSINFDAGLAFPVIGDNDTVYRFGYTGGFSFRSNSLFNLDSTSFSSVKNDVGIFNLYLGAEVIAYKEHLSFYFLCNMMSITNNRNVYHAYFRPEAQKDFIYPQLGMKFKVLEGQKDFKNLIVDFSMLWIGDRMKTIVGNNNTIIPILKVGYVQRINLKDTGKK